MQHRAGHEAIECGAHRVGIEVVLADAHDSRVFRAEVVEERALRYGRKLAYLSHGDVVVAALAHQGDGRPLDGVPRGAALALAQSHRLPAVRLPLFHRPPSAIRRAVCSAL